MSVANVKSRIKTLMAELVTAETLGGVTSSNFNHDVFDFEVRTYPHVFIQPPAITDEILDNRTLLRTSKFTLQVIENGENIPRASETHIETLAEAILDKLANEPSLNGNATAGSEITVEAIAPTLSQHNNKSFVVFDVIIEAKTEVTLTF